MKPGTTVKPGQALKDYLLLMSAIEPPSGGRSSVLLSRWRGGDAAALRELVEAYLPKVIFWVAPRRGEGFSLQELIAIGNSALIEALKGHQGGVDALEERLCQGVHDALDTALKMGA